MSVVGKCNCGAVEVSCDVAPKEIIACHCENCQRATGGPSSFNIVMPETAARVSKGQTRVFTETSDSGNQLERHFCAECGSPIFSATPAFAGHLILKAGLFQGVEGLNVVMNIYTDSAASWAHIDSTIPSHAKMPG